MKDYWIRISSAAKEKGLTLSELSTCIGRSPKYITAMKSEDRSLTTELLMKISTILDVSADFILFGKERSPADRNHLAEIIISMLKTEDFSMQELEYMDSILRLFLSQHKNPVASGNPDIRPEGKNPASSQGNQVYRFHDDYFGCVAESPPEYPEYNPSSYDKDK